MREVAPDRRQEDMASEAPQATVLGREKGWVEASRRGNASTRGEILRGAGDGISTRHPHRFKVLAALLGGLAGRALEEPADLQRVRVGQAMVEPERHFDLHFPQRAASLRDLSRLLTLHRRSHEGAVAAHVPGPTPRAGKL